MDGKPLAEAAVSLRQDDAHRWERTRTDAEGRFTKSMTKVVSNSIYSTQRERVRRGRVWLFSSRLRASSSSREPSRLLSSMNSKRSEQLYSRSSHLARRTTEEKDSRGLRFAALPARRGGAFALEVVFWGGRRSWGGAFLSARRAAMRIRFGRGAGWLLLGSLVGVYSLVYSQRQPEEDRQERFRRMSEEAERRGLAEPFRGLTTDGEVIPGLFSIRSTGVSTEPVRQAALAFLAALTPDQRAKSTFPVDDDEWRKWMNQHFYVRRGVGFNKMSEAQRAAAFALLRAALSARGLQLTRDIMRLNHTLAELNDNNFDEYGEWLYWITVMGEPSATDPWGWQLDGHHLIVNYFVLGDQVVMTPSFFGSEPVIAHSGKYEGTYVLQEEQRMGLALIRALDERQRSKAVIEVSKTGNNNLAEAFKDNLVLDYAGIPASEMSPAQQERLLALIERYVGNMREGHARVKMDEVRRHLDDTWFAWIGGTEEKSVFYYRIHSPVILIEFDHQLPVGLRHLSSDPRVPDREHIHTVIRTPNGNDYGKDLLRQHYERHPHPH